MSFLDPPVESWDTATLSSDARRGIALRVGKHRGPGRSQTTTIRLSQARRIAYELFREIEQRQVQTERLNEEAAELNRE